MARVMAGGGMDATLSTVSLISLHRHLTHSMAAQHRTRSDEVQLVSHRGTDHDSASFYVNNFAHLFEVISDFKKVSIHKSMVRDSLCIQ